MPRYLKDTHPLYKKFDALIAFAEEQKVKVHVEGHQFVVTDLDTGHQALVCDIEPAQDVWDLPPTFEYRLRILEK